MPFDVKTLYLLNIVVASVLASVCFSSWLHHRDTPSLLGWAVGLSLGALGSLLIGLATTTSTIMILIVGNTMIVTGYAIVWISIRRFNGSSLGLHYGIIAIGLFAVPFAIACLAGADMLSRIVMVSTAIGSLSLLAGWEVFRARQREPMASRIPTSLAFAFIAVAMVVRVGVSLFNGPSGAGPAFGDPLQGLTLFINTVCVVVVTLGLLMMVNERLRRGYEKQASTDDLTGLPNRRFFLEHGERLCSRAARDETSTCILLLDLDHFSAVNRQFGHAGGDHALAAFAAFVQKQLRPADFVARYGGEEFCVLLLNTDQNVATRIAERLREGVAEMEIDLEGRLLGITVSIGLARVDDGDLAAAILRADVALYRAKALGRNLVCSAADEAREEAVA